MNQKRRVGIIVNKLNELFPHPKPALNYSNSIEFLFAVILSAQCTDVRVNIVTKKLFQKYPTLEDYVHADLLVFEQDIKSTGFYHNKAKNILATSKILSQKYNGVIPNTMDELLLLPGVARKTANVVLTEIYHKSEGIAVDTHVRRLSMVYGLTKEDSPEKIEKDLMKIIPKSEWPHITLRLIEYGRHYCPAKKHRHELCPLTLALNQP